MEDDEERLEQAKCHLTQTPKKNPQSSLANEGQFFFFFFFFFSLFFFFINIKTNTILTIRLHITLIKVHLYYYRLQTTLTY